MTEPEIIPTLTQDERAILMIAAQGESVMDMGEPSRWAMPIRSLIAKGYLRREDQFNNFITAAGRAACDAVERAADTEVEQAITKTRDGLIEAMPYGPTVVNGKLFFKLLDGSTVTCNCIGEPYASQIVEACRARASE